MHKNWPAICDIGRSNKKLMALLAEVDMTSEWGRKLMDALPQYFSRKKVLGPIPLSILEAAEKKDLSNKAPSHGIMPYILDNFNIPFRMFTQVEPGGKWQGDSGVLLPPKFAKGWKFKSVVMWRGKSFIVTYCDRSHNDGGPYINLAPAKYIDLNL